MERPLGKHRLCLVRAGRRPRVQLEVWYKTRRRKEPWDRMLVATMGKVGESDGLVMLGHLNTKVLPLVDKVREAIPEFDALAIVETVSLR